MLSVSPRALCCSPVVAGLLVLLTTSPAGAQTDCRRPTSLTADELQRAFPATVTPIGLNSFSFQFGIRAPHTMLCFSGPPNTCNPDKHQFKRATDPNGNPVNALAAASLACNSFYQVRVDPSRSNFNIVFKIRFHEFGRTPARVLRVFFFRNQGFFGEAVVPDDGDDSDDGCTAQCSGVQCGSPDGCGSTCTAGSGCYDGSGCVPFCSGVACGSGDGCGGVCSLGSGCSQSCVPNCAGVVCGAPDGCGGVCGVGSGCQTGCTPQCSGVPCGYPDACGGACEPGSGCSDGSGGCNNGGAPPGASCQLDSQCCSWSCDPNTGRCN